MAADDDRQTATLTEAEAQAAAEMFFTLEAPLERDALIDQLAASRWPDDELFFLAVMANDQDAAVQHAAALALTQRGHAAGPAWFRAGLAEDDEGRFVAAAEALVSLEGAACYPRLLEIWRDAGRDRGIRRQALQQMQAAHLSQALADITEALATTADTRWLEVAEADLEAALWAVAHSQHTAARPVLTRLRDRLAAQGAAQAAKQAMVITALGWLEPDPTASDGAP